MTLEEAQSVVSQLEYLDWKFHVSRLKDGEMYLQVQFVAPDSDTGVAETQKCRKWHVSAHATKSEVVGTAFAALERAVLHEVRERFKYNGETIYNSHWDVDALHQISRERGASAQDRRPRPAPSILFYGHGNINGYGFLSNFYPSPFEAHGLVWPTVEHYFQAMKAQPEMWSQFAGLATPQEAKFYGRRVLFLRSDWNEKRVEVMMDALRLKFGQNSKLSVRLQHTAPAELHEDSPTDFVWGWRNGGQDLLGKCLMAVRAELLVKIPA